MPHTLISRLTGGLTKEFTKKQIKNLERLNPRHKRAFKNIGEACRALGVELKEANELASFGYQFYKNASIAENVEVAEGEEKQGAVYQDPERDGPVKMAQFIMHSNPPGQAEAVKALEDIQRTYHPKIEAQRAMIKDLSGAEGDPWIIEELEELKGQMDVAISKYMRGPYLERINTEYYADLDF